MNEPICECGDVRDEHVDDQECTVIDCLCTSFNENPDASELDPEEAT